MVGGIYTLKKLSLRGLNIIKSHEGLRLERYKDEAGLWTIGYGHLIQRGENYTVITKEQAEQILLDDVAVFEDAIKRLVSVPLNQNQLDALISFTFNVGIGAFRNSTMLRKLNNYDYHGALAEFARWNKVTNPATGQKEVSRGLTRRRGQEQQLFIA